MDVVVSVTDDSLSRIAEVVAALKAVGLVVDDVLDALGMVTGSIDPEAFGSLAAVPGVAEVERQRVIRLPPPT